MAAPMSFLPRMIIGGTTFAVVVVGAFYFYYKSRHIFRRKPSTDSSSELSGNIVRSNAIKDIPKGRKVNFGAVTETLHHSGQDLTMVSLVTLLKSVDDGRLCRVLTTIANKAAFTEGQNALRHAGGLPAVMSLLRIDSDRVRTYAASCIANLSLNNHNQPILKTCIPILLSLSTDPTRTDDLRLASLQALVNLSVSGHCEEFFRLPALRSLFKLLGDGYSVLAQQVLRVLVNLSADETVVPALLYYEVPEGFIDILQSHHTDESLLRTLSFLLNLKRGSMSPPIIVVQQTADDPLHGNSFVTFLSKSSKLLVVVKALTHHGNEEVKQQAGRLLYMLSSLKLATNNIADF